MSQRPNAKMRVDQLKYDIRHLQVCRWLKTHSKQHLPLIKQFIFILQTALQNYQQKKQRQDRETAEREQLLNRRFTANTETSIDIDYSLQQHSSMNNAHRGVDEMLSTGNDVLGSLRSQRDTLKGAHKRILDIGNTLGLSNHTMRLIERRIHEDKYVVFGGMAVTTFIICAVIYYFVL